MKARSRNTNLQGSITLPGKYSVEPSFIPTKKVALLRSLMPQVNLLQKKRTLQSKRSPKMIRHLFVIKLTLAKSNLRTEKQPSTSRVLILCKQLQLSMYRMTMRTSQLRWSLSKTSTLARGNDITRRRGRPWQQWLETQCSCLASKKILIPN